MHRNSSNHDLYSPACCHYDPWRNELKKTLDSNDAADAGFYTDPDFAAKTPPEHVQHVLERVMENVMKVEARESAECSRRVLRGDGFCFLAFADRSAQGRFLLDAGLPAK